MLLLLSLLLCFNYRSVAAEVLGAGVIYLFIELL